jgi:putative SOS response-associated peptidase YedK
MCGRASQKRWKDHRKLVFGFDPPEGLDRGNIRPTQDVHIVINEQNEVKTVEANWWCQWDGAKGFDTKYATFNARVDRLDDSRLWKDLLKKGKRCLMPVTSFYEWPEKGKPPEEFFVKDHEPFALAGLWSNWVKDGEPWYSFAVFTTEPNDFMRPIHEKAMPVVLDDPDVQKLWLLEGDRDLLVPYRGVMESERLPRKIEELYPV